MKRRLGWIGIAGFAAMACSSNGAQGFKAEVASGAVASFAPGPFFDLSTAR